MTYWQLQVFTASRLLLCPSLWLWCWWKRPRRMAVWMALAFVYFFFTDHFDGQIARNQGLESELGYWLDHAADFLFYGVIVFTIVKGSREPALLRRRRRSPPAVGPGSPSGPGTPALPSTADRPPEVPPTS